MLHKNLLIQFSNADDNNFVSVIDVFVLEIDGKNVFNLEISNVPSYIKLKNPTSGDDTTINATLNVY